MKVNDGRNVIVTISFDASIDRVIPFNIYAMNFRSQGSAFSVCICLQEKPPGAVGEH